MASETNVFESEELLAELQPRDFIPLIGMLNYTRRVGYRPDAKEGYEIGDNIPSVEKNFWKLRNYNSLVCASIPLVFGVLEHLLNN